MSKPIVAVTYSKVVGGYTVISLKRALAYAGFAVIDADFRQMMADIPEDLFHTLYDSHRGRRRIFAHAKAKARKLLQRVNCLAISGNNAMIDPSLYGRERLPGVSYDFSRTIIELALLHIALNRGIPVIGICGGHQLLSIYSGGTLRELKPAELDNQPILDYAPICIPQNSLLSQALKIEDDHNYGHRLKRLYVFGAHCQITHGLPRQFGVAARTTAPEQQVEALESLHGAPLLTTQFHPEVGLAGLPQYESVFLTPYPRDKNKFMHFFYYFKEAALTFQRKRTVLKELKSIDIDMARATLPKPKGYSKKNNQRNLYRRSTVINDVHISARPQPHAVDDNRMSPPVAVLGNIVRAGISFISTRYISHQLQQHQTQATASNESKNKMKHQRSHRYNSGQRCTLWHQKHNTLQHKLNEVNARSINPRYSK